jgi:hypothetical protein
MSVLKWALDWKENQKMNNSVTYFFKESPIQFDFVNGYLMANATLMGKPYNVKPEDLFKTKSWRAYQEAVSEAKGIKFEYLRTSKLGSPENGGGSWIHQELIIEFARRLNPSFSIWCNDRIAELLKDGKTEIIKPKSQVEMLLASVQILADQEKKITLIESRIDVLEAQSTTSPTDYFAVAGFWSMKKAKIDTTSANRIGRLAAKICKENGYMIGKVPNAQYGSVNTYPSDVLSLIFNQEKNLINK